jgi:hypothetical protein
MRKCFPAISVVLLALATAFPDAAIAQQDAGRILVSKAEAKCIADNIDGFLEDPADPTTIYLDICIPAQQLSGLVAGNIRSDLPTINPPKTGATPTKSIAVSKSALRCLKAAAAADGFPSTDPFPIISDCH